MKAIKSITIFGLFAFAAIFVVLGGLNSIYVDDSVFMANELEIKFAKRIDDMNGEVTVGRLAASLQPWKGSTKTAKPIDMNEIKAKASDFAFNVNDEVSSQVSAVQQDDYIPEPAVKEDLELTLTGGLYNKAPLKDGQDFEGRANIVDGVVEDVQILLPDGKEFTINTRERMVGNVFEYEDSETREMRSGLFYEVNKGTYMITLTDDTNYAGLRLEFKTQGDAKLGDDTKEQNWEMNAQNNAAENNEQQEEYEDDNQNYQDQVDEYASAQDFNQMAQDEQYQDEYQNEDYQDEVNMDSEQSYGHNFN